MPLSRIYSSTLNKPGETHEIFGVNSLGVGYLEFQIWAESTKPFQSRYAPSKLILFTVFFFFFSQHFLKSI